MKVQTTIGIMLTLFLTIALFTAVPVKAARPRIIIGVQGPVGLPHWTGGGMWDAAQMAADEINGAPWDSYPGTGPGIDVGGTIYDVQLEPGNEFAVPTPDPNAAALDTQRLIVSRGCQFIIGGFRTECTTTMIEKAMQYANDLSFKRPIFIIDGASTDELIGNTVGKNYPYYKYLFRVMPDNSTTLVTALMGYLKNYLIPLVLLPKYGYLHPGKTVPQVDVAVVTEDLKWTELIHFVLTNPAYYPNYLGPYANVTYQGRIPDGTTDCSSWLSGIKGSGARIMVHIFSGTTGDPLITQWKSMNVGALPIGINVMGQLQSHWAATGGGCEGEVLLDTAGTRTPVVPGVTEVFWDRFVANRGGGNWPIYTAWGAYESIYLLKAAIERADTLAIDNVVTELENTNANAGDPGAILGKFKFTPKHDVYCAYMDCGPIWYTGYARPVVTQWQAGRKEVLSPINPTYARMCALPSHPYVPPDNAMYPYPADTAGLYGVDGRCDTGDMVKVGQHFGTTPSSSGWQFLADVDHNQIVDTNDLTFVATDFTKKLTLPPPYGTVPTLPYGDETGKW